MLPYRCSDDRVHFYHEALRDSRALIEELGAFAEDAALPKDLARLETNLRRRLSKPVTAEGEICLTSVQAHASCLVVMAGGYCR